MQTDETNLGWSSSSAARRSARDGHSAEPAATIEALPLGLTDVWMTPGVLLGKAVTSPTAGPGPVARHQVS